MTKAYALTDSFGLENLELVDWPVESVPYGHVRLAIEAVSLNRRDLLLVEGKYAPRLRFPAVPCSDAAGRIAEVGPGCSRFAVGDRAVAHMFPDWPAGTPRAEALRASLGGPVRQGTLRTDIVLPEASVLPIPGRLDAKEAATLPCAGLTAWAAVAKFGRMRPGQTVLIQGAGGVSIFALQFAKLLGATVVAISSAPERLARLRALGADAVLDYHADPQWPEKARALSNDGFDLVVEVVGGDGLDTAIRLLRPGGMVALIGQLAGNTARMTLPMVVMRQIALQGVTCGSLEDFRDMLAAIGDAKLNPVISTVIPFARARDAFALMRDGSHVGKIVVDVAGG